MKNLTPAERIENKIYLIRGHKVMLDFDLAVLYGTETKYLKRQVKRNKKRFPPDFLFPLTREEYLRCQNVTSSYVKEYKVLRSQIVTSNWGGRRYLPFAFTEQGVAMLSSVLNSERAIQVNIQIMRTFTKLRRILFTHEELKRKIDALEQKYDRKFKIVFVAINALMSSPQKQKLKIGFLRQGD